jgi:hypothetical protein
MMKEGAVESVCVVNWWRWLAVSTRTKVMVIMCVGKEGRTKLTGSCSLHCDTRVSKIFWEEVRGRKGTYGSAVG